jgi:hypothetical protein
MDSRTDQAARSRRGFLAGSAVAGIVGIAGGSLRAEPAAAADQTLPWIDVRSTGALGDGKTDDTDAIQRAIDTAYAAHGAVVMAPGRYAVRALTIRAQVRVIGIGAAASQFPIRPGDPGRRYDGVEIVPFDVREEPLVTLSGTGATLEHVTVDGFRLGVNDVATGSIRTGVAVVGGFESRLESVRVQRFVGPGIEIRRLNNARWSEVFVDRCGTATVAAVVVDSGDDGAPTNFVVFDQFTIQHSANTALAIAWGSDPVRHWASNLTFIGLHLESTDDDGRARFNSAALLQIGNARQVTFVAAFVLGLASPLVEFDYRLTGPRQRSDGTVITTDPGGNEGGVQFLGGEISQRGTPDGFATPQSTLVRLTHGREFVAVATKFDQLRVPAVTVESTFGAAAVLDASCTVRSIGTPSPAVVDRRTRFAQAVTAVTTAQMAAFGEQVRFDRQIIAYQDRATPDTTATGSPKTTTVTGSSTAWAYATNGTDIAGHVSFGAATVRNPGTLLATVTFKRAYTGAPVVTVTPSNARAAAIGLWVDIDRSGRFFRVYATQKVPVAAAGTYVFGYHVIGLGIGAAAS